MPTPFTGPRRPEDILGEYMDPTGALQLGQLRNGQRSELTDRLVANPRDESARILLSFLNKDESADPFTGDAEHARADNAIKQTDAAMMTQRPEIHDAAIEKNNIAGDLANKTSYGTAFGKGTGEANAAETPAAQFVADKSAQRDISKSLAPVAAGPVGENVSVHGGMPQLDMVNAGGGSSGGGGDLVGYWASQVAHDPSLMTTIAGNKGLANAVRMHLAQSGGDVNKVTNQTRQMGEAANDLLPMIDKVQASARDLQQKGLFDIPQSSLRQFLVSHGAGSLLGYGDGAAEQVGRFQTDLGLLQSGVARAHAGARGAGNSEIAARFEKLMNAGGDLPTFLGDLNGVRDLLSIYSKHAGSSAAPDAYSDPNYQPR